MNEGDGRQKQMDLRALRESGGLGLGGIKGVEEVRMIFTSDLSNSVGSKLFTEMI